MTETQQRMRNVTTFVVIVAIAALASLVLLVTVDVRYGEYQEVNWLAFALFSVLLFLGETRPTLWMRFGEGGEVTPGWAFAYARCCSSAARPARSR